MTRASEVLSLFRGGSEGIERSFSHESQFSRRRFLGLTLAGLASALPPGESRAAAPVEITVMAYGVDAFDEKYMRTVIRPFEAAHPGILVRYYAVRDSRNALAVLRSQRMTPNIDVVILTRPTPAWHRAKGCLSR